MISITLVNIEPRIYPPLGLVYIASYLRKCLDNVKISIVEANRNVTKKIIKTRPDVVGFTSTTSEYNDIIQYSKELKQYDSDLKVIVGGSHITSLPNTLSEDMDIGVIGEGEQTILEVLEGEKPHEDIMGICFHKDNNIIINLRRPFIVSLDTIPNPTRDLLNMKRYLKPSNLFFTKQLYRGTTMLTSRGCLYKCRYCQASKMWGKLRLHTPEYIVNEMMDICEKYKNIEAINIVDDIFAFNKNRLAAIVKLMKETGFLNKGVKFNINSRSDLLNNEIFKLLKQMGVKQVGIGFESCSDNVLNYLKRDTVTVQQNKDVLKLAQKYNIAIGGQFMFGSPNETINDMQQTRMFIKENLHKLSHAHVSITTPLPDTELWDYAINKGIIPNNIDWSQFRIGFNPIDDKSLPFYLNDKVPKEEFLKFMDVIYREVSEVNPTGRINISLETLKKVIKDPYRALRYLRWILTK